MRCNNSRQGGRRSGAYFAFILRLLWAGLVLPLVCSAAPPIDKNYLHRMWQLEDGLPRNTVFAVTQTRDGFIWVGTQSGLARFDGMRFHVYSTNNTPALKDPVFTCLLESNDGSLWIGTDGGGLNRYKDGKFEHFSQKNGLSNQYIRSLCETKDGTLWIGTIDGVFRGRNDTFTKLDPSPYNQKFVVRRFCEGSDGRLWMAVNEGGLFWYENGNVFRNDQASLVGNGVRTIRSVFEDSKRNLWFGSTEGLHRLGTDGTVVQFISQTEVGGIVNSIFEDQLGNLWIGTYGGLTRLTDGRMHRQVTAQRMSLDVVNSMCRDFEGNLWIATKEGLSRLKARQFQAYTQNDGLSCNNIMAIHERRKGGLWVSSWGGTVDIFNNGNVESQEASILAAMQTDLSLALCETRDGTLWVGFDFDHGIVRIRNGQVEAYRKGTLFHDAAVRVIFEDSKKNVWVGTRTALYLLKDGDPARVTRLNSKDGLAGDMVKVILEDQQGQLWFGTSGGLTVLKDGKFSNLTTANGLSAPMITSLYEDKEGTIWVGTTGGGINRYRNGKFTSYQMSQGLYRNDVFDVLEDDNHDFWMTCREGIFRVRKSDFDDVDTGKLPSLRSTVYGKHEGLVTLECNAVAKPSALKTSDGKLWFCTAKGLVVTDPRRRFETNLINPPILIDRVIADKKVIFDVGTTTSLITQTGRQNSSRVLPTVQIAPGGRELEFHYTALSFNAPEQNKFRYKLEGFDTGWVEAGTRRVAYYSNLRPGEYTFKVEGSDADGHWAQGKFPITIELLPQLYQTKSFYAGCIIGVLFCSVGIHRLRVRQLRKHQHELELTVHAKTKDLKEEIARREKAQAETEQAHRALLEASHKAGMAEVASGVLHNVGNVLNSVNVAATCVMEQIRNSRQAGLRKVAAILQENQTNLPSFFATDPRSGQLPDYLTKLSEQLGREQSVTLKELEGLCKNVDHIKDIVAMQQNYAKVSGVIETLDLRDLIEDALRLNAAALARHDVQLVRRFDNLPVIATDKHKVLQILINLIRNAKYACDESQRSDKQLIVSAKKIADERVQITVTDNGVGIPPENIARIFSHGFTTRASGHGFGLHSAALAAVELGGTLTAHSAGKGQGAAFILEIPIKHQPTKA